MLGLFNNKKRCLTCRYYELAPIRGRGWCTNPHLYQAATKRLVDGKQLSCDSGLDDFWEAKEPEHRAAAGVQS